MCFWRAVSAWRFFFCFRAFGALEQLLDGSPPGWLGVLG
jgi:hypothetical protein